MKNTIFYIVDVFTERKYAGNQLAVFMPGHQFSDEEMQQVAREINFSETTFILSDRQQQGGYNVRIFTPGEEVPFAGHPTLGTAYIILQKILRSKPLQLNLNLKVGQILVTVESHEKNRERLWMKQIDPQFQATFDAKLVAEVLNLSEGEIDSRFPVQQVSTGLPFIIIPLKSLDAVKKCQIDKSKYFALIRDIEAKAILVFAPQTYDPDHKLNIRVFVDYFGIPEDPATGSANGCLTGYLVKHRYFGKAEVDIQVEQGYEIGRPSILYLRGKQEKSCIQVWVGGEVVLVAKGEWIQDKR
jgi:trans-2,3-dihydro-3-hydroxyanthranilate isomerase